MSLKTFLSGIWRSIKKLFNGLPAELKIAIHIGVVFTEKFKDFIESDYADILVAFIPGKYDDYVLGLLRSALPEIFIKLKLIEAGANYSNLNELIKAASIAFNALDDEVKPAWAHNLSIMVAQAASDKKISWSDGVYLQEWYYKTEFKAA